MPRQRKLPDGMVTRSGRRGYYADFRVNGRRIQKRLGTDFEAARTILNELRARAEKADFDLLDNNYSLVELRQRWEVSGKQSRKPRTMERYRQCLNKILPALSVTKVSQITESLIAGYREKRLAEKASPRTINAEVQALGCMLNWGAHKAVKLIGSNPISDLRPLPHDHPKHGRPLSSEEMKQLFEASPPHWRDVWYAYAVTGMRASELIRLEFSPEFIDWESREIILPRWLTKNREERRIPIDDQLYAIFQRLDAVRQDRQPGRGHTQRDTQKVLAKFTRDRIFVTTANTPLQRTNLYRSFIRCCARAGIETKVYDVEGRLLTHVDLHSLRRTFITEAISNGGDPGTIQQIVGHKTLRMTMNVYHKANHQTKRKAIGKLPYGSGASAPDHILELAAEDPKTVQNGDCLPASSKDETQKEVG